MPRTLTVPPDKQRVRAAEGIYLKASGKYLATYRTGPKAASLPRPGSTLSPLTPVVPAQR